MRLKEQREEMTHRATERPKGRMSENRQVPPERIGHCVGAVFSTASLREVATNSRRTRASDALAELARLGVIEAQRSRHEAVRHLFRWLGLYRRSEYFYKNIIANKLLFGRHSPRTTTMLFEFGVGDSVLDCLMVNGRSVAYEVKSELDNPTKIATQLADYRRLVPTINIVTHHTRADEYLSLLRDSGAGLIAYNHRGNLSTVVEPTQNDSELSVPAMFKTLRKPEYREVIRQHFGGTPDVPNGRFFRECFELAQEIEPSEFHASWSKQVKSRQQRAIAEIASPEFADIRALCLHIDPSDAQLARVRTWLQDSVL